MNTQARFTLAVALLFVPCLSAAPAQAPALGGSPTNPESHCSGSIGVPLEVSLAMTGGPVSPGSSAAVELQVRPGAPVSSIQYDITSNGAAVSGEKTSAMPAPATGELGVQAIPIQYQNNVDRAVVTVHVVATSVDGETWERTESLYTLFRDDRVLTGMSGFIALEIQAIEEDYEAGLMSEEEAVAATRSVQALPVTTNQTPIPPVVRSFEEQALVDALVARPEGQNKAAMAVGCITISGHIEWQDENGVFHPAFGLNVQVWDEDLVVDEFVDVTATDTNGDYYIEVDGNDGFLQGDRDVYVKVVTANSAVVIKPQGLLTGPYEADSPVHDETPCGSGLVENFSFGNADPNPSVGLCEGATWIAFYTKQRLNGGSYLGSINFEWPGTTTSANYNGSRINLRPGDRWDWDVLMHEYGHYIQDVFNTEDNPGGPHNIGDCVSDVHTSKSEGVRLAWGEAWPTYNGTVAQQILNLASLNVPRVGDISYGDTGESNFSYSLETQSSTGIGEDNEVAVQRILWDLYDAPADGRDNVTASDQTLFGIIAGANPTTLSAAWAAIRGTLTDAQQLSYGAVSTDHAVGPSLIGPANGSIVTAGNNIFSWSRGVGCSTTYDGDGFTLRFFNAVTSAPVLSIGVGNATSYALSLGQLQTLIAAGHNLKFAVEGSNSSSPATGPYLGESFSITVDQPPVADAGADTTVECTSPTTTTVQLDGTGSTDPDGDDLTYSWSPAGLFDDATSPSPTGHFSEGTTQVTLTVSDGILEDEDTVFVTIEDTTAPMVFCPNDTTIECNDHCEGGGVPRTDDQLTDFFAGFTADDVCDTSPTLSNNAPQCFPLGDTPVTFKACDDAGNCDSCTAVVTVADTTPPEITVELDRDALWPPNHKMIPITVTVTVTDVCDPNPTFVLTEIQASELDNGTGDGNFANDIQEAAYDTPDTTFLLRAERSGAESGRKYTIIYTAMDESGNTAADTVCVTVPHDQSGNALVTTGFNPTGTALDSDATQYRIVITLGDGFDPSEIDVRYAQVGNANGVIQPLDSRIVVLVGGEARGLELVYPADATRELRSRSNLKNPIGLHYHTGSQQESWLVQDIFALGAPVATADASPDKDASDTPDIPEMGDVNDDAGTEETFTVSGTGLIQFSTRVAGPVQVDVFSVTGRKIRTLLNEDLAAGRHDVVWDVRDSEGRSLSSGIYFYRIQTPETQRVFKVRIVR